MRVHPPLTHFLLTPVAGYTSPMRILVGSVAVLLLAGCATTPFEPPLVSDRQTVEWEDYSPGVQDRIDVLEAEQDCAALQDEFDTADANSAATLERTGHSNANLMGYIDEALELAGCYQ
jgi:hypothetical protein